jgi:hypothetical protein
VRFQGWLAILGAGAADVFAFTAASASPPEVATNASADAAMAARNRRLNKVLINHLLKKQKPDA